MKIFKNYGYLLFLDLSYCAFDMFTKLGWKLTINVKALK